MLAGHRGTQNIYSAGGQPPVGVCMPVRSHRIICRRWVMSTTTRISAVSGHLWMPRWPEQTSRRKSHRARSVSAVPPCLVPSRLQICLRMRCSPTVLQTITAWRGVAGLTWADGAARMRRNGGCPMDVPRRRAQGLKTSTGGRRWPVAVYGPVHCGLASASSSEYPSTPYPRSAPGRWSVLDSFAGPISMKITTPRLGGMALG